MGLLNRITFYEYDTLKDRIKEIKNNLDSDSIFEEGEPERAREVLQSWEALKVLNSLFSSTQLKTNIENLGRHIENAFTLYSNIISILPSLETKSNSDHLEPMRYALSRFSQITEI